MRYSKTKSMDTLKFNYIYKQIVFNCFIFNINETLKLKYYSVPLSGVVFTDADNKSRTGGRTSKGKHVRTDELTTRCVILQSFNYVLKLFNRPNQKVT